MPTSPRSPPPRKHRHGERPSKAPPRTEPPPSPATRRTATRCSAPRRALPRTAPRCTGPRPRPLPPTGTRRTAHLPTARPRTEPRPTARPHTAPRRTAARSTNPPSYEPPMYEQAPPGPRDSSGPAATDDDGSAPPPPGPLVVDRRTRQVWVGEVPVALTPKEFELLALLTEDPGAVYSRQQILNRVWDDHYQGPTKTLDVHVATLRRKLGDPAWIQTLRGVGFRLAVRTPGDTQGHGLMTRRLLLSYLSLAALVLLGLEIPLGFVYSRAERERIVNSANDEAESVAAYAALSLAASRQDELVERASALRRAHRRQGRHRRRGRQAARRLPPLSDDEEQTLCPSPRSRPRSDGRATTDVRTTTIGGVQYLSVAAPVGHATTRHRHRLGPPRHRHRHRHRSRSRPQTTTTRHQTTATGRRRGRERTRKRAAPVPRAPYASRSRRRWCTPGCTRSGCCWRWSDSRCSPAVAVGGVRVRALDGAPHPELERGHARAGRGRCGHRSR